MLEQSSKKIFPEFFLKLILGLILSVLSAFMLIFSFSPYNLSYLVLIGFVPMLVSQYKVLPERISSIAPAITIGCFLGFYLMDVFAPFNAWYMKSLPIIIAVIVFFTDRKKVKVHKNTDFKYFVLGGVFSWVGIEYIRMFIPAFGTWAFLAYAFYNQPWFIQPVKIFSIFGLGIFIMLINYSLGLFIIKPSKYAWKILLIALFVVIFWTSLSLTLYRKSESQTVRVGVIQVNPYKAKSEKEKMLPENLIYDKLIKLSYKAAKEGAKIILWPEGALNYDPKNSGNDAVKKFTKATNSYLIIPYVVYEEKGERNEATILNPEGKFLGVFGKDHPVVFAGETSITRGTYPVFETQHGKFGLVICYDLDFTDTSRKVSENGAQIIFAPSKDWPQIAEKHYVHSVFRAVENEVSIVKGEWAYDSAIVDPFGRIIEKSISISPEEKVIVSDVPLGNRKTVYSITGDLLGLFSFIMMIVVQMLIVLENKKKKIK